MERRMLDRRSDAENEERFVAQPAFQQFREENTAEHQRLGTESKERHGEAMGAIGTVDTKVDIVSKELLTFTTKWDSSFKTVVKVLGSLLALGAFFQGIQAVHMLHILGF